MQDLRIGEVIKSEQQKDAIHVAVAPVTAAERLAPGQHIGFIGERAGIVPRPIGIVDPFLKSSVFEGEMFWMFLYPGSITSLRHDWTHAAFTVVGKSETWLRNFADEAGIPYEELLAAAENYLNHGDYLCEGDRWEEFYTPDEFWIHYEAVTDTQVEESKRGNFFSCSC